MKKNRLLLCYSFSLRIAKMMLSCVIFAMITLISSGVWAQSGLITVKGKVTDQATGETLIGVSIKASSGAGVNTGVDGTYTIMVNAQGSLTFTYVGYNPSVVSVAGKSIINAGLVTNNKTMNEVVVVGYGEQKKKDVAGAVTHVSLEDSPKENVPYVNAL